MGFVGPPSDLAPGFMGPSSSLAGPSALGYGGYGSALGQGLGIAGGVIAGYNEYNAAGGGLAGLAGGAAYGVGTYYAGAAIATTMSAGLTAGLAAIPVVGWIALAAMAINAISGGKLFGTAAKPIGGDLTETIGPGGATLTNVLHEKGQRALFGGAYYKDKNLPIDPASQAAADAFFAALTKGTADFASQFGLTMTTIVGGSFDQKYDKNGKPTTTSDTVLGVTYTGETQAQFAARLQADSFLAVLDKMGIGASKFVASVQSNADTLLKDVQDLASASQTAFHDIKSGMNLLGAGSSLGDVMAEVMKLSGGPGTLAQTYADLSKATQALNTYLATASLNIGKTGAALVEFANDAAKAAGSADNLAKLMQTFAQDFYTAGHISAANIAQLRGKVNAEGAGIGQSANETDAQFLAAYNAVVSSLTPEQLVAWQQFGVDLHSLNTALDSAAQSYDQFIAQFTTSALSPFESAMVSLGDSLTANIKKANDLAVANGQSGASEQDRVKIILSSVTQGVQALQKLEAEAENLTQSLFGTDLQSQIDKLKAQAAAGNQIADIQLLQLSQEQAAQQAQAKAQQQFLQAATLLGDVAQIGAISGQSLPDLAKMLGIPLDKFAAMLHTDQSGLASQFKQQEDMAKAALDTAGNTKYTNELLADILAQSQGKPLPYTLNDINDAATGVPIAYSAAGGKGPGQIGAKGPVASGAGGSAVSPSGTSHDPVTTKNPDTTTAITNQTSQIVPLLREIRDRTIVRDRYYSPRNSRPVTA